MQSTYSAFQVPSLSRLMNRINISDRPAISLNVNEAIKLAFRLKRYHPSTFQHSLNVTWLAYLLAQKIGLYDNEINEICLGAFFHDIGKMGIDRRILNKPGRLTQDEWNVVLKHPDLGVGLLSKYEWAQRILPIVLYHHERLDGQGYKGLCSEQIPLGAKIVCLADAFDAMISPRPYREVIAYNKCVEELQKCSGNQFEIDLVKQFASLVGNIYSY